MAKESYPWQCERDGTNVRECAERPIFGGPKTHKEWHNSETGRETEPPEYANQPATPTRRK
jgi:hypothetical protein